MGNSACAANIPLVPSLTTVPYGLEDFNRLSLNISSEYLFLFTCCCPFNGYYDNIYIMKESHPRSNLELQITGPQMCR